MISCKKKCLESYPKYKIRLQALSLKDFTHGDRASISLMFVIMFPVILVTVMYFKDVMEADYVAVESQAIVDTAVRGSALTGQGQRIEGNVVCIIPYDDEDQEHSGYHVAKALLQENIMNLPPNARDAIQEKLDDEEIDGLVADNTELSESGISKITLNYKYEPSFFMFGKQIRINKTSVAKCTASGKADDGNHLTELGGTFQGPSGRETFYDLDMSLIIYNMQNSLEDFARLPELKNFKYRVRDDGVKVVYDDTHEYVIVAANLQTHPKGSIVETSLGQAIVLDLCGAASSEPTLLDIATTWSGDRKGNSYYIDSDGIAHR